MLNSELSHDKFFEHLQNLISDLFFKFLKMLLYQISVLTFGYNVFGILENGLLEWILAVDLVVF